MLKLITLILAAVFSGNSIASGVYQTNKWERIDKSRIGVSAPSIGLSTKPTLTLDIVNNGNGNTGMAFSYFDRAAIPPCSSSSPTEEIKVLKVNDKDISFRAVCNVNEGMVLTPATLPEASYLIDALYSSITVSIDNVLFTTQDFPYQAESLLNMVK